MENSKIIQVDNVHQFLRSLNDLPRDAVIMVDVDDTLIRPSSKFFNKIPYKTLIDEIKRDKDTYPHYEMLLSNWRLQRKIMLVDEAWPSALAELKRRYRVYGLTKIDTGKYVAIPSMEEWRYQELKGFGLTFRHDTILEKYHYRTDLHFTNKPLFYQGIFMTGSASKSQTIALYKQILTTSYVVVIDDRIEHLRDIEEYCRQARLSFLGVHFTAVQTAVDGTAQDDAGSKIADFQKKHFLEQGEWLEDDEAATYMYKK